MDLDARHLIMRLTGIEKDFGGEIRRFDLSPIGAWRALEANCNLGIGRIWGRLATTLPYAGTGKLGLEDLQRIDCSGQEIREALFQGLKGGGMPDADASKLIRLHFDEADGKLQFGALAFEVVTAYWLGSPEGKTTAPQTDSEATAPAASTSAPSMEPVQP